MKPIRNGKGKKGAIDRTTLPLTFCKNTTWLQWMDPGSHPCHSDAPVLPGEHGRKKAPALRWLMWSPGTAATPKADNRIPCGCSGWEQGRFQGLKQSRCLGSHGKHPHHTGVFLIRENWILASKVMTWGKVGTAKNTPKLQLER